MRRIKSWERKLWYIIRADDNDYLHFFCSRDAAIMWLKRYGVELRPYRLNGRIVMVVNGYVYFWEVGELLHTAESKKTATFATRNN